MSVLGLQAVRAMRTHGNLTPDAKHNREAAEELRAAVDEMIADLLTGKYHSGSVRVTFNRNRISEPMIDMQRIRRKRQTED